MKESYKDAIVQAGLTLFGVTGLALSYSPDPTLHHWSPCFGLASQPFWFYMTYKKKLWGAFFMTILYTAAWSFGVYQNFFKQVLPVVNGC